MVSIPNIVVPPPDLQLKTDDLRPRGQRPSTACTRHAVDGYVDTGAIRKVVDGYQETGIIKHQIPVLATQWVGNRRSAPSDFTHKCGTA